MFYLESLSIIVLMQAAVLIKINHKIKRYVLDKEQKGQLYITKQEGYLGPCETSKMDLFRENSEP